MSTLLDDAIRRVSELVEKGYVTPEEILESCYIKKLEHDIDALKSWIETFWKIDFGAMADAVAEERRRRQNDRKSFND